VYIYYWICYFALTSTDGVELYSSDAHAGVCLNTASPQIT